jgi:hypothetical protein
MHIVGPVSSQNATSETAAMFDNVAIVVALVGFDQTLEREVCFVSFGVRLFVRSSSNSSAGWRKRLGVNVVSRQPAPRSGGSCGHAAGLRT